MDVVSDIRLDEGKDAATKTICWRVRGGTERRRDRPKRRRKSSEASRKGAAGMGGKEKEAKWRVTSIVRECCLVGRCGWLSG